MIRTQPNNLLILYSYDFNLDQLKFKLNFAVYA